MAKMEVLHLTPTQRGEMEGYLRKRNLPASVAQRHRCAHGATRRLRDQPAKAEANRRVLRLAEDDRSGSEGAAPRDREGGVDYYVCGGGLQPGADAEFAGQRSWGRMSPGRSVFARGQSGQHGPRKPARMRAQLTSGTAHLESSITRTHEFARSGRFSAAC